MRLWVEEGGFQQCAPCGAGRAGMHVWCGHELGQRQQSRPWTGAVCTVRGR